jgi:hypothetical protein
MREEGSRRVLKMAMPRSTEPNNKIKNPIKNVEWPTALSEPRNVTEATYTPLPKNMSASARKDTRKPTFPGHP